MGLNGTPVIRVDPLGDGVADGALPAAPDDLTGVVLALDEEPNTALTLAAGAGADGVWILDLLGHGSMLYGPSLESNYGPGTSPWAVV